MSEFNFVKSDELLAKIEDQLSYYVQQGVLDSGRFYTEIRFVLAKIGLAAFEVEEAIVKLEDHKAQLPCDFYMLDSAWLCNKSSEPGVVPAWQSHFVYYTEKTCETLAVPKCGGNYSDQYVPASIIIEPTLCPNTEGTVLDKVTVKEFVIGQDTWKEWSYQKPLLLKLRNAKSLKNNICKSNCKNLFATSPYEISINQDGNNYILYSTLEDPLIFLRYYKHPIDNDTGLPMIPDDPIVQRAIEYYLMYYFFFIAWLNNDDEKLENKVRKLEEMRDKYMTEAINYCKTPSFNKMVEMARKSRKRFSAYERAIN